MNPSDFYNAIRFDDEPEHASVQTPGVSISKETSFYMRQFHSHQGRPFFLSRNLPAFFFGPIWFLYRRMYMWAAIVWLIPFGVNAWIHHLRGAEVTALVWEIGAALFISLIANALYIQNTKRRYRKGLRSAPSKGAIYTAVLGGYALIILVVLILNVIFLNVVTEISF